jgi:precorrin-4/cobalt-precorrin-4 C11-methyltransferase
MPMGERTMPKQDESLSMGTVWFIGAGPGDPELITVKGRRLIAEADLVLYAGSLVPKEVVAPAKAGARVVDSSSLDLETIHALMRDASKQGDLVARVHTGDPMLYGAAREQLALLKKDGIPCAVVPGISAAFAAAAAAGVSLTVPERVQSFAVTRLDGRTPVPAGQGVCEYARHGGTLAVYLSAKTPDVLAGELRAGGVGEDVPILLAHKVGWPDEKLAWATLATLENVVTANGFTRQTVFLVLPGELDGRETTSRLYAKEFTHEFRR